MPKTNQQLIHTYPFLDGGGQMGEYIRSFKWEENPLGCAETWPIALQQSVSMMLKNNFPVLICWGPEYIQLYNDAFRPINGTMKHPQAIGGSAKNTYAEIWETIGPMFSEVMDGKTHGFPGFMVRLERNGEPEDCFFDFSCSPIADLDGIVQGVLVICIETTEKVMALKRSELYQQNLRKIVLQAPVGMCIVKGSPLMVEEINERFLEIIGKSRDAFKKTPYWDVNAEARATYEPITDKVMATGKTYQAKEHEIVLMRHGKPETIFVNFVYEPIKELDGSVAAIMIVATEVTDQVVARKELQAAYEKADLAREAAQLGTFDMNLEASTMEWDKRCRQLFGINHMGAVTYEKDFLGGLHPEDRDRIAEAIANAYVKSISDGIYDVEYRTVAADNGEVRWLRAKGKVYFDNLDHPVRFIGSVLDITDKKSTEVEQAMLAAIITSSDDAIISKTLDGMITSWNNSAERLFGYSADEAIGRHITMIIPKNRLNEETVIIGKIRNNEKLEHFETIRLTKDGRLIPISLTVSPIRSSDGKVIGASKIVRDIGEQKVAESKLKDYAENLEVLNMVGRIISEDLDVQSILQKVTDATTQLTGASFGAFFHNVINEKGESYMLYTLSGAPREAFEKFGMPRNTAVFAPTFNGEGIVRVDDITKDPRYGHNAPHNGMPKGHLPVVSYLAVPVISKSGIVVGGLFFGHPEPAKFTAEHEQLIASVAAQAAIALENAKLYEEIKVLNAKKDEFIGLASHELKTPVTSINGYLQIIEKEMNPEDRVFSFINKARAQVGKLSGLISDLLDVSKIQTGQLPLTLAKFDLVPVLKEVCEVMQQTNRTHELKLVYPEKPLLVYADQQRIEQVIINLISNSVKYSPGKDSIVIRAGISGSDIQVSVMDFGIGIPADQHDQIFSRFYRVANSAQHISGLGIGLYISYEIVYRHNGKMWLESEPGKGSTFFFSLPLTPTAV